jgi:hypothetical protein
MARRKEGKRHPLNMRTTKELREKLEQAAAKSGRSLVGEVEYRLERSFDRDETVKLAKSEMTKALETWLEGLKTEAVGTWSERLKTEGTRLKTGAVETRLRRDKEGKQ